MIQQGPLRLLFSFLGPKTPSATTQPTQAKHLDVAREKEEMNSEKKTLSCEDDIHIHQQINGSTKLVMFIQHEKE